MTYTKKQQQKIDALRAVQQAQIDLFNACFDLGDVEGAVKASEAQREAFSQIAKYRYDIEKGVVA